MPLLEAPASEGYLIPPQSHTREWLNPNHVLQELTKGIQWLERNAGGQSHADREALRYHGQKREEDIRHETHSARGEDGAAQAPNAPAQMSQEEKTLFAQKLAAVPVVGGKGEDGAVVVECPTAASVVVETETVDVTVYVTEIPPSSTPGDDKDELCDEDGNRSDEDGNKIDEDGNKIDENGNNKIDEDESKTDDDGKKVDEADNAEDDANDDDTLIIDADDFGNDDFATTTDCDEDEATTKVVPGTTKTKEILSSITSDEPPPSPR